MLDSGCLPFLLFGGLGWVLAATLAEVIRVLRRESGKRAKSSWKQTAFDTEIWARKNLEIKRLVEALRFIGDQPCVYDEVPCDDPMRQLDVTERCPSCYAQAVLADFGENKHA